MAQLTLKSSPGGRQLMRGLLALLLCTLLTAAAHASGGYGGYSYNCSPTCDGIRVTYIEPVGTYLGTNGEVSNTATLWVGLDGNTHGTQCTLGSGTNNPLIQFGTQVIALPSSATTHTTWYEEFPCNNITPFAGPTVNGGDTVFIELLCTANCTAGDINGQWQMTWKNVTTGSQVQHTETGYQVFGDHAWAVVEISSAGTNSTGFQPLIFPAVKFIHAEIHQSGSWIPMPLRVRQARHGWEQVVGSPSTMALYGTSPPIGANQNDFFVCSQMKVTARTIPDPCPASTYNGSNGLGP
jgi:hypothetical protein